MRVEPLGIPGAALLWPDVHADERGDFHRVVDLAELTALGAEAAVAQVSVANNRRRGTVRGLHFQAEPHGEAKTLWCHAGSVFDVLVDVREGESTYGTWLSVVLSAEMPVALHVPRGVAHGYQTLEDDSSLTYFISAPQVARSERRLHWRDPTVGIEWPLDVTVISARDQEAPPWPPLP